jgi:hypothetical protein
MPASGRCRRKVGGILPECNNRIVRIDFLNQTRFSKLRGRDLVAPPSMTWRPHGYAIDRANARRQENRFILREMGGLRGRRHHGHRIAGTRNLFGPHMPWPRYRFSPCLRCAAHCWPPRRPRRNADQRHDTTEAKHMPDLLPRRPAMRRILVQGSGITIFSGAIAGPQSPMGGQSHAPDGRRIAMWAS